jgi:hypothetical protein
VPPVAPPPDGDVVEPVGALPPLEAAGAVEAGVTGAEAPALVDVEDELELELDDAGTCAALLGAEVGTVNEGAPAVLVVPELPLPQAARMIVVNRAAANAIATLGVFIRGSI